MSEDFVPVCLEAYDGPIGGPGTFEGCFGTAGVVELTVGIVV
jgi:hypothetical protein